MLEIFDGTIIAQVAEVAKSGDFSALKLTDPVLDTDIVVGDMTDLEKAVFTLMYLKERELGAICGNCQHLVAEKDCDKREHAHELKSQIEAMEALGWPLIQERLKVYGGDYSLREGFKIVKEAVKERRSGSRIQVISIGIGGRTS